MFVCGSSTKKQEWWMIVMSSLPTVVSFLVLVDMTLVCFTVINLYILHLTVLQLLLVPNSWMLVVWIMLTAPLKKKKDRISLQVRSALTLQLCCSCMFSCDVYWEQVVLMMWPISV